MAVSTISAADNSSATSDTQAIDNPVTTTDTSTTTHDTTSYASTSDTSTSSSTSTATQSVSDTNTAKSDSADITTNSQQASTTQKSVNTDNDVKVSSESKDISTSTTNSYEKSNINSTVLTDNSYNEGDTNSVSVVNNDTVSSKNIKQATTHQVTNDTFDSFFENGFTTALVNEGDTLDFDGDFISDATHNFTMTIDKPINIISSSGNVNISLNSTSTDFYGESPGDAFTIVESGSGTNVTGIYFYNTQIFVKNASNIIFDNITCINENQAIGGGVGVFSVRAGSSYVTVKNSYFRTEANGGHSTFVLADANYCTFDNNTLESYAGANQVGNLIYLTTYNVDVEDLSTVNQYNNITNNVLSVDKSMSVCYGISIYGRHNLVENNTITNPGGAITLQWDSRSTDEPPSYNTYNGNIVNGGYVVLPTYTTANNNTFNVTNYITLDSYSNITNNTLIGDVTLDGNYTNVIGNNITFETGSYSINVKGSYNNITDNFLNALRTSGDESVSDNGIENVIENNKPYNGTFKVDSSQIIVDTENDISIILVRDNGETIADNGTALITIGDYEVSVEIINGMGSFTYTPTKVGTNQMNVTYTSSAGLCKEETLTVDFNVIRDPSKTYNVNSYEELLQAIATISALTNDEELYIVLQANDDPNAYDVTEPINWGTGVIKNIIIDGNGQTINGNNQYQFAIVSEGYTLNLERITLENCASTNGGAINNNGNLTITESKLTSNTATVDGGAIYNTGYLEITDTTFSDNKGSNNEAVYTTNTINMTGNTFTLDTIISLGDTIRVTSPIVDTSLSSDEKVTFELTRDNSIVDTTSVTKNSDNVFETEYNLTSGGSYLLTITYDSIYTQNTIQENIYVQVDDYLVVTSYDELKEAINQISLMTKDGSYTITLLPNSDPTAYDITEPIIWDSGVVTNITIDGNGQTINGLGTQHFLTIGYQYNLQLININIENCYYGVNNNYGCAIYTNGSLSLINSTIQNNDGTNAVIYINGNRTNDYYPDVELINVTYRNNSITQNAGIYLNSANLLVVDSTFSNNTASAISTIYAYNHGNVTISNSNFINNTQSSYVMSISSMDNVDISDLYCENNLFTSSDYVLYINSQNATAKNITIINNEGGGLSNAGNLTLYDSVFTNNTSGNYGSGIHNTNNITVNNSIITNSSAGMYGGAISSSGNANLSNIYISNCYAGSYAGAIYASGNNTLYNISISDCSSKNYAGAIYNNKNLTLYNVSIDNCTAGSYAGAIYSNSVLIAYNLTINNCESTTYAGAIYNTKTLTIYNSTFTNNKAGTHGGVIYSNAGDVTIENSIFANNSAPSNSGTLGLYNVNAEITNCIFENNTGEKSGAIYTNGTTNLTLSNSVLNNNTATEYGDAIQNTGNSLTLINNTIINTIQGYSNTETNLVSPIYDTKLSSEVISIQIGNESTIETTSQSGLVSVDYTFTNAGEIEVTYNYPSYDGNIIKSIVTIDNYISVEVESKVARSGSSVTLTANINECGEAANGGYLIFKVNGKTLKDESGNAIEIPVVDGVAEYNYTLPYTTSDTYTVSAVYMSKDNMVFRSATDGIITLEPQEAILEVSVFGTLRPGETVTLNAFLRYENQSSITSGKVVFKLNGVSLKDAEGNVIYAYVDENGIASINYTIPSNFSAKDYTLTAVFQANGFERTETNETITISKIDTSVSVDSSIIDTTTNTITITQGENLELKATIIDQSTGNAVSGTTKVAVKINEKTVVQQYVTDGVIDLTIYTSSFKNPTYSIEIIAGENSQYNKSTYNGTLSVLEPNSLLINETSNNGTLSVLEPDSLINETSNNGTLLVVKD